MLRARSNAVRAEDASRQVGGQAIEHASRILSAKSAHRFPGRWGPVLLDCPTARSRCLPGLRCGLFAWPDRDALRAAARWARCGFVLFAQAGGPSAMEAHMSACHAAWQGIAGSVVGRLNSVELPVFLWRRADGRIPSSSQCQAPRGGIAAAVPFAPAVSKPQTPAHR